MRLEEKVTNISHNISLLMVALARKLGLFEEVRGPKSKIRSDRKLGDNKDLEKESWKEPKKEHPSSSDINPPQSLFKSLFQRSSYR